MSRIVRKTIKKHNRTKNRLVKRRRTRTKHRVKNARRRTRTRKHKRRTRTRKHKRKGRRGKKTMRGGARKIKDCETYDMTKLDKWCKTQFKETGEGAGEYKDPDGKCKTQKLDWGDCTTAAVIVAGYPIGGPDGGKKRNRRSTKKHRRTTKNAKKRKMRMSGGGDLPQDQDIKTLMAAAGEPKWVSGEGGEMIRVPGTNKDNKYDNKGVLEGTTKAGEKALSTLMDAFDGDASDEEKVGFSGKVLELHGEALKTLLEGAGFEGENETDLLDDYTILHKLYREAYEEAHQVVSEEAFEREQAEPSVQDDEEEEKRKKEILAGLDKDIEDTFAEIGNKRYNYIPIRQPEH